MIPEDVLMDKDGLEALMEQSALTFEHKKPAAETPVKEKVQEFSETQPASTPDVGNTMAVTDVTATMAVTDISTDVS